MPRLFRRLLTALLVGVAIAATLAGGALASGQFSVVVTHGVSMNPVYYQGDLVIVERQSSYQVGEIVAYHLPGSKTVVLHRIIAGDAAGFTIKGDNNQSTDATHPTAGQIIGHAVVHLSGAGKWLQALTSPVVLGSVALALMAFGGTAVKKRNKRKRRRKYMSRHHLPVSEKPLSVGSLPSRWRDALTVTAIIGVAGLALAALAWSRPLEQSTISKVPAAGKMVFSYTAAVGHTPAYDGATVTSPDPVFRKLANTVDVHYAYQGSPGTVTVTAELTTPGGWHSTVPLAAPVTFTGNNHQGTLRLDLVSLDARAAAAAAVTGLPGGQISIALTAQVQTAGAAVFSPVLLLSLTPLQLTLTGPAAALTVTNPATIERQVSVPAALGLGSWHIPIATARVLSAALLVAALLVAGLSMLFARRAAPGDEATVIRSRYASMLVRVEPMTTLPGRPVIDVATVATLAKLAERYGLLILHWSRSDVETFIVQDDSGTYRYRAGAGTVSAAMHLDADVIGHQEVGTT